MPVLVHSHASSGRDIARADPVWAPIGLPSSNKRPEPALHRPPAPLDTIRSIGTPEGIELELRLAGPIARAFARGIDSLLQIAVFVGISVLFGSLGGFGTGVVLVMWFITLWLLPAWFEVHKNGATPGKRAIGLRVVRDDGRPVGWGPALTRNLLWVVDFLPAFFAAGLATMLLSRDFKRLGDLAAGTIVVYAESALVNRAIPEAEPQMPDRPLSLAEQRTILEFAERVRTFTQDRATELAELPTPILNGARGHFATQRLLHLANFLIGRSAGVR